MNQDQLRQAFVETSFAYNLGRGLREMALAFVEVPRVMYRAGILFWAGITGR